MSNASASTPCHRGTSPAACAILTGILGAIGAGVIAHQLLAPVWLVALATTAGFVVVFGMVFMAAVAFGGK